MENGGRKNKKLPSEAALSETCTYLEGYSAFRRLLEGGKYDKKYFGNPIIEYEKYQNEADNKALHTALRLKMFEIRRFVLSIPGRDEKTFLFLRYIHGETMESCAEKMHISPRNVYRLKNSALSMAALYRDEYLALSHKARTREGSGDSL